MCTSFDFRYVFVADVRSPIEVGKKKNNTDAIDQANIDERCWNEGAFSDEQDNSKKNAHRELNL